MRGEREERGRRPDVFGPEWGGAGPVWAVRGELGRGMLLGQEKGKNGLGFGEGFGLGLVFLFYSISFLFSISNSNKV